MEGGKIKTKPKKAKKFHYTSSTIPLYFELGFWSCHVVPGAGHCVAGVAPGSHAGKL